MLRELLVGDVCVTCTHRFTLASGIFRFSHVTLNMRASLISGCTVSLVFDAPYITVAPCSPTLSDGCVDSWVQEFDLLHTKAIRDFLDGHAEH